MPYATLADLTERYGERELVELTDRIGAGVVDMAAVSRALADAEAEIDGYLRGRYALPTHEPVPPVLMRIACDLARYQLASERASEEVRTRYDDARRLLEAIATGRVRLGLAPADASAPGTGGSLEVAQRARSRDWGMLA